MRKRRQTFLIPYILLKDPFQDNVVQLQFLPIGQLLCPIFGPFIYFRDKVMSNTLFHPFTT